MFLWFEKKKKKVSNRGGLSKLDERGYVLVTYIHERRSGRYGEKGLFHLIPTDTRSAIICHQDRVAWQDCIANSGNGGLREWLNDVLQISCIELFKLTKGFFGMFWDPKIPSSCEMVSLLSHPVTVRQCVGSKRSCEPIHQRS